MAEEQPKVSVEGAAESEGGKEVATPRRGPLAAFGRLESEMEQLFDNFLNRRWLRGEFPSLDAKAPKVDVIDREKEVVVKAELPGFDKDEIEASVSNNVLTIKGTSQHEEEKEEGDYHRKEISSSYVFRTVPLPADVDSDAAKASLTRGVLTVTVPKTKASGERRISIDESS